MAEFNPNVPKTNDPNWLGWSKSISQPSPDTSGAASIDVLSSVIEDPIKAAHYIFKTGAETEAYDETRALQDERIKQLEKADISTQLGGVGRPTDPNASSRKAVYDAPEVMPDELSSQNKPRDLKALPQNLDILDSARGNGKLSETAYYGRLVALSKDLRSKYPGYREYIDQEMQRVSGVNAANIYAKSILGDINSYANAGREEHTKVRNIILDAMKHGIPEAAKVMSAYDSGILGPPNIALPKIMEWMAPVYTLERQLKVASDKRAERKGTDEDTARDTEELANRAAITTVSTAFKFQHTMAGSPSPEQSLDIISKAKAGVPGYDLTQPQAQRLGEDLMAQKGRASIKLDEYFDTTGPDGRSMRTILGAAKVAAIKQEQLSRFDTVKDLIFSKDYGSAHSVANLVRQTTEQDVQGLQNDKDLGFTLRTAAAMEKMGFEPASRAFMMSQLATGLPEKYAAFVKNGGLKMATQPSSTTGVVDTLKKQVETLQEKVEGANTPAINMTYDKMIGAIEYIADPANTDVKLKKNLAKAAFSSGNIGLLTKFDVDSGSGPTFKPGRFSVFNRLFSEDMTKSVKALGPETWDQYKETAKHMFGRELFGPELKQFTQGPGALQNNPDVLIGWDSDRHQIKYKFLGAGTHNVARDNYNTYVKSSIDKINFSLNKMTNIAKEEGSDVDAYLLGVLKEHGVDTGRLPGIPEKLMKEIVRSRSEAEEGTAKFEERYTGKRTPSKSRSPILDRALPFATENAPPSGSLGEFLSNPLSSARGVPTSRTNAPAASTTRRRGNLSDERLISTSVEDVAPNADINEVLRRR